MPEGGAPQPIVMKQVLNGGSGSDCGGGADPLVVIPGKVKRFGGGQAAWGKV